MQVHLLLVNLSHIEDLVYQVLYAMSVVLNGVDVVLGLGLVGHKMLLEFSQRSHDEGQR